MYTFYSHEFGTVCLISFSGSQLSQSYYFKTDKAANSKRLMYICFLVIM